MLTLVFLVRLDTTPLFSTRSNSKLPFWLTGEKVSSARCEFRIRLADMEGGRVTAEGGGIWRAERGGIGRGLAVAAAVSWSCIGGLWTSVMIIVGSVLSSCCLSVRKPRLLFVCFALDSSRKKERKRCAVLQIEYVNRRGVLAKGWWQGVRLIRLGCSVSSPLLQFSHLISRAGKINSELDAMRLLNTTQQNKTQR